MARTPANLLYGEICNNYGKLCEALPLRCLQDPAKNPLTVVTKLPGYPPDIYWLLYSSSENKQKTNWENNRRWGGGGSFFIQRHVTINGILFPLLNSKNISMYE